MSEISRINFNLPQANLNNSAKAEEKVTEKPVAQESAAKHQNNADILNALNFAGQYNAAQLGIGPIIDPSKYLTPERIKDIENSMAAFEGGTKAHAAMLENEFGHMGEYSTLSEAEKLEMAAKSFAHSG